MHFFSVCKQSVMPNKKHHSFGLPASTIGSICDIFAKYAEIQGIILYGSRALGNYRLGSDIDLCIDAPALTLTQLLKIENQIDDLLLPWNVDLSLKHKIDNPTLLQHIAAKGINLIAGNFN